MSLDHSAPTGRTELLRGNLRFHPGTDPSVRSNHFPCINCGADIDRTPGTRPRYFGSSLCARCQDPEHFGFPRSQRSARIR